MAVTAISQLAARKKSMRVFFVKTAFPAAASLAAIFRLHPLVTGPAPPEG